MVPKKQRTTVTGAPRPKVNATRAKWPPIHPDPVTGKFDQAYIDYTRDLILCKNLVLMGSSILKRKLELIVGGPDQGIVRAATDGTRIWLPKMHPRRRLVTKHELSHLYFLSDLEMRRAFTLKLIDELEQMMGTPFAPQAKDRLLNDIEFLINIFDDVRVNSLWGILYPGDGIDLDEWYYRMVGPDMMAKAQTKYPGGDIDDLFTFAILLCLDQDPKSTEWGEFKEDIQQAKDKVLYQTFPAALAIVRDLLFRILKKMAARQKTQPAWGGGPISPDQDIDDLMKQRLEGKLEARTAILRLVMGKPPGDDFVDHNGGFDIQAVDGTKPTVHISAKAEQNVINLYKAIAGGDIDGFLQGQEAAGVGMVQQVQKAMTSLPVLGNYRTDKDFLQKATQVDLDVHNIPRSDLITRVLDPGDKAEVVRLKTRFQRVQGSTRTKLEENGHELCTDAYIQQKLNGEPLAAYYHDVSGRGFRVTLLIDMSGSMSGIFGEVERLAIGLQKAMDFPFVHLRVMGFQQTEPGRVDVLVYPPRPPGLRSISDHVQGATPLSHAIAIAAQWMKGKQDDRSIFLISDGKPVFTMKDSKAGSLPERTLMTWTKEAVEEAVKQKVRTFAFMLGDDVPSDPEMDFMFGARKWKKIPSEKLFETSFEFLTKEFLKFVRSR